MSIVTTGAPNGGGAPPNRLEINTLIKDQVQFSLYIQALTALFQTPQDDPLSQFGLGSIHGLPFKSWNGAGADPVDPQAWGGYCTHGSMLFPTWHRPYVALYEQALQSQALTIAQSYSDQNRWVDAANRLRAPYWDWATNSVPPPEVTSLTTISILVAPDGTPTDVPNPLYQYTFNPIDQSFPSPYDSWQTTIRSPDSDGTTNVNFLISSLQRLQNDLTQSTYNLCMRVSTWPAFSNHTRGDGGSLSNSLEGIHDKVHGGVGGHMGSLIVAAFDPIFFLHHCNVDRILSLWAAIHSGVWVTSGPADGGSWTIPGDATIDASTPLAPFRNSADGYWPSSATTTTAALNYSYPEFNGLGGDPTTVRNAIIQYVSNQYGGGRFTGLGAGFGVNLLAQPAAAQAQAPVPEASQPFRSRGGPPHPAYKPEYGNKGPTVINDWTCRIHCKKYELGDSYWVLIFLGEVPENPSEWRTCSSFVGGHYCFVNSMADKCSNCRSQADLVTEGFVHLNAAIASRSGLSSYDKSVITPYLKENLHWRIQTGNRQAIDLSKLPSLEVTVAAMPLTYEPGTSFPSAGEAYYHHHITYGRPGGAIQAQVA